MDPNIALANLRSKMTELSNSTDPDDVVCLAVDISELWEALDGWMTKGGFSPWTSGDRT